MTGVSLERLADTLYPKPEPKNSTAYGTVESINADGSYQVKLNASATTTRCAKLCDAGVGDRVLVLIQANGHCAAIGRVGGAPARNPITVLYNSTSGTGTGGTVTLSESAANFDHMRIYFKKNGDANSCASVDVYKPDGKTVSLLTTSAYQADRLQLVGRNVQVSGTSITQLYTEMWINLKTGSTDANKDDPATVYIYRVEAW